MMDTLNMSDEDFLKAPMPTDVPAAQTADQPTETDDDSQSAADTAAAVDAADDDTGTDDQADNGNGAEPAHADEAQDTDDADDAGTAAAAADQGKEDKGAEAAQSDEIADAAKDDSKESKDSKEPAAIDYKAEYDKLMATFKANGRDFSIKSVEDARALMQMGANYSKKMKALKPNLKLMKTLENAGLLSEDKINYVIDLMANKPGAVNKLVKDHGIDPIDVDAEKAGEYEAGNHTVSDTEVDLDEIMTDLQESPKFGDLISLVKTELDHASRKLIEQDPSLLRSLDHHMNVGIYDVIMEEFAAEQALGRLKNVPFLHAYKQIGDAIQARGGFNDLPALQKPAQQSATPSVRKVVVPPKSVKADEGRLNEKRRAASSNRPVVTTSSKAKEFDPLSMSDEDFAKLGM